MSRAADWLKRRLKTDVVPLWIIKRESAANDIAYTTLRRAFCGMRGISQQTGNTRLYTWSLPGTDTVQAPFPPGVDLYESEEIQTMPDEDQPLD